MTLSTATTNDFAGNKDLNVNRLPLRMTHRRGLQRVAAFLLLAASLVGTNAAIAHGSAAALPAASHSSTSAQAEAVWELVSEHWYVISIGETRAGWAVDRVERQGDVLRSTSESSISLGRGSTEVTTAQFSQHMEKKDGTPISILTRHKQSTMEVESVWTFDDTRARLEVKIGDNVRVTEQALPDAVWFMPQAASAYVDARVDAGATEYSFQTIEPENGLALVTVSGKRTGEESIDVAGREIPVEVWTCQTSSIPVPYTEKRSTDGYLVESEIDLGIGILTTRVSTQEEAQRDVDGPAPEIMVNTLVKPNRPLEDSLKVSRATYRLTVEDGDMPKLPTSGAQTARTNDDGSVTVIVDAAKATHASAEERGDETFRDSSTMIDADDALVRKLAKRAVRGVGEGAMERAEAMRAAVLRHITGKGMSTAFASAGETARTRAGDCTEHAVLLAAMLRAEGIPSRVATGLVYVDFFAGEDAVFGWHMWTQALIDGAWVDFDATLPERFHGGHILTSSASLADNESNQEMNSFLLMMGALQVEIVDYEHGAIDNKVTVDEEK